MELWMSQAQSRFDDQRGWASNVAVEIWLIPLCSSLCCVYKLSPLRGFRWVSSLGFIELAWSLRNRSPPISRDSSDQRMTQKAKKIVFQRLTNICPAENRKEFFSKQTREVRNDILRTVRAMIHVLFRFILDKTLFKRNKNYYVLLFLKNNLFVQFSYLSWY